MNPQGHSGGSRSVTARVMRVATLRFREPFSRGVQIGLAVLLGVSVLAYFTGLSQSTRSPVVISPPAVEAGGAGPPRAPTYRDMGQTPLGPNADWESRVGNQLGDSLLEPVTLQPEALPATLQARAERRAFAGAPPVIPHQVDAKDASDCMACHERGLRMGDLLAPGLPHEPFANCTQCHAPPAPRVLGEVALVLNDYQGLSEVERGERASPGSPPLIPHSVWLRERCTSCHGPLGRAGLRSSHPWRVNCRQCHAARGGFSR